MRITRVTVSNYRNIDGITVNLNTECNYIIGENNLGKSNFLSLLDTVCNGNSFNDEDYFDTEQPIMVELEVKLIPEEQGFFGDNFSPDDASRLTIQYTQLMSDARPSILSVESNESIPFRQLRKINYLKYETTTIPSRELRIDTQKGAGLLVNSIIERFISNQEETPNFLNSDQIRKLSEFINEHLGKIRSFGNYAIKVTVSPNPTDMLTSLFYLSDGERKINDTGSGFQYMAMASINILCQIMQLYKSKTAPFEEQVYTDKDGKKILPLVLSVDEPEVHLHPFLQRSLISYYKRILNNEDVEFTELLKQCFGIDGLDGQLIIVTHSTDALIGDYRNLIRFYKDGEKTKVISGADLTLSISHQKHLIMRFPEIKEAFYSHCAILIEGETEYGCIPAFADEIGILLDDNGICVINAKGEGTITQLKNLLKEFKIPCVCIFDGDVKKGMAPDENVFFTQELCFEIEIVTALFNQDKQEMVKQIALELDPNAKTMQLDYNFVKNPFKKMGIDLYTTSKCENCGHTIKEKDASCYTPITLLDVDDTDREDFIRMYSAWFMVKKGVLLGRIIGDKLTADLIPLCYTNALKKAQELASNV